MFPIIATMFGVLQWLVLRKHIPKSGWWIFATIVGLGGGVALATVAVQALSHFTGVEEYWNFRPGLLMLFLLIGFFLALAQLPILWRHFQGSLLWLLASMIGWLVLRSIDGWYNRQKLRRLCDGGNSCYVYRILFDLANAKPSFRIGNLSIIE